jgi:hypothetical protein
LRGDVTGLGNILYITIIYIYRIFVVGRAMLGIYMVGEAILGISNDLIEKIMHIINN